MTAFDEIKARHLHQDEFGIDCDTAHSDRAALIDMVERLQAALSTFREGWIFYKLDTRPDNTRISFSYPLTLGQLRRASAAHIPSPPSDGGG